MECMFGGNGGSPPPAQVKEGGGEGGDDDGGSEGPNPPAEVKEVCHVCRHEILPGESLYRCGYCALTVHPPDTSCCNVIGSSGSSGTSLAVACKICQADPALRMGHQLNAIDAGLSRKGHTI